MYTRSNAGVWTQDGSKLVASDDVYRLGVNSAISGDGSVILLGVWEGYGDSKGAFIYMKDSNNGQWTFKQRLFSDDGNVFPSFSVAVNFAGDVALTHYYYSRNRFFLEFDCKKRFQSS